jgi:hypothetical protein
MADAQVAISRIGTERLRVPILGTAPLIVHKFSEKSKRQMLDAMQGRKTPKQPKEPATEYEAACYRLDDGGYGFPVIAFKAASVSACRLFGKAMPMTTARQCVFLDAEFSKRDGQKLARLAGTPHMREDVVRVGMGGTDLRYRPEFTEWSTTIDVTYVKSMVTRESVLSLIEAGGLTVGVGEWRPEKKGDFGTYQIDETRDVEVLS